MSSLKLTRKRKETGPKRQGSKSLTSRSQTEELLSSDDEVTLAAHGRTEYEDSDRGSDLEAAEVETADAKRLRVARAYLDKVKAAADQDGPQELEEEERLGVRDSLVATKLQQQNQEDSGRLLRKIACRVLDPALSGSLLETGRSVGRRHRQSVTSVTLTSDDTQAFSASKDGLIVQWDVETSRSVTLEWPASEPSTSGRDKGQSVSKKSSTQSSRHILAMAVSFDGRYLAAGGLDQRIHVWDTRTQKHVQAFKGHRGAVSGLAFRDGTHQLFSGSYDRSIKIWSIDDLAYMDSLYGHQSEVVALDCLRSERVVSAGRDRTCRVWKVPEETQLVLRGHSASIDCCAMIGPNDFISGSEDGSVALWSSVRKKPVHVFGGAHGGHSHVEKGQTVAAEEESDVGPPKEERMVNGDHSFHSLTNGVSPTVGVGGAVEGWVGAVTVCRGSDLAASGAGDGFVRLWQCDAANRRLTPLHKLPTQGFVNSLVIARSGRFLLAGTGQEPRLGRWGRIKSCRNGVIMHNISLSDIS